MKLLALDLSTKASGFAIFNQKAYLGSGVITAASQDVIKRIHKMVDTIDDLIQELGTEIIVMEEVIPDHTKNQATFKALIYLQALLVITLHDKYPNIQVEMIYPGTWRSICGIRTGRGITRDALKQEDIKFVNSTYDLNIKSDDEADAICIGHTFLYPKEDKENEMLSW